MHAHMHQQHSFPLPHPAPAAASQVYNCSTSACVPGTNAPVGYAVSFPLCANYTSTPGADCTLTPNTVTYNYSGSVYTSTYNLVMANAWANAATHYLVRCAPWRVAGRTRARAARR